MNSAWQTFLAGQGASISPDQIADFPAAAQFSAQDDILVDLSHLALLQVSGDDTVTFLQGQVTNDVSLLDGSNSHYAGYCNPKGRMLALFLAFANQGSVFLQFHGALRDATLKRLKMYVLRSRVSVSDITDSLIRLGVAGAQAPTLLQQQFGAIPAEAHQLVSHDAATLLRLPGTTPRFELFTTAEHAPALWQALQVSCRPVGHARWDWLEIHAGVPDVTPGTLEAFVPQMVNLDLLDGINFKKGCYTGQEIVARTHYLGKVKRRTYLAHADVAEMPQPGAHIFGTDSAEPVGMVIRAAAAPDGGYDLLAEIRLESVEAGALRLASGNDAAIQLLDLPYSL